MIYYVMYLIGWARGLIWRAPDVAKAQPFTTSTSTRTSPIEIGAAYLDTRELGLHQLTLFYAPPQTRTSKETAYHHSTGRQSCNTATSIKTRISTYPGLQDRHLHYQQPR